MPLCDTVNFVASFFTPTPPSHTVVTRTRFFASEIMLFYIRTEMKRYFAFIFVHFCSLRCLREKVQVQVWYDKVVKYMFNHTALSRAKKLL